MPSTEPQISEITEELFPKSKEPKTSSFGTINGIKLTDQLNTENGGSQLKEAGLAQVVLAQVVLAQVVLAQEAKQQPQ